MGGAADNANERPRAPGAETAPRPEFLEIMRRENEAALFDEEAKRRLGEAISRSMRQGNSEFSYSSLRPRRR